MTSLLVLVLTSVTLAAGSGSLAYQDVPKNAWYGKALAAMREKGVLDSAQSRFRPAASATRAEFLKLTLALAGKKPSTPPLLPSFDDAGPQDWYYPVIEEAAKQGWMRGTGNCYGTLPCKARPDASISRGEALVLLTRAFGLERWDKAPSFIDADPQAWYAYALQAAADRCIVFGDRDANAVRPHDPINRAEMIALLYRTTLQQKYGVDCGKSSAGSTQS